MKFLYLFLSTLIFVSCTTSGTPVINDLGGSSKAINNGKEFRSVATNDTDILNCTNRSGASLRIFKTDQSYKYIINHQPAETIDRVSKGQKMIFFKRNNVAREVDLHIYIYKPNALTSDTAVEVIESSNNGSQEDLVSFIQKDCQILVF